MSVSTQSNNQLLYILSLGILPVLVAFSFFFFVYYRSRREAAVRQQETALRLSVAEGELTALRAQINPHFIFNCMNSIHDFIQSSNAQASGEYLIRFSQVIRHVLESSAKRMVPLEDEILANRNYLELELLRMDYTFAYEFVVADNIHPSHVQIAPMILQPFIENAIWHGLSHRKEGGRLEVRFERKDGNHLACTVWDNGPDAAVERSAHDLVHHVKKTSMGLPLIQERLKNMNTLYGTKADFRMETDPSRAGKSVVITIPFEE